jgi:8-oxo-dGTP pyrophosphatase MutT (NUDIX family)
MGYVLQLRQLVGSRPLVVAGATSVVLDGAGRVLMGLRTDNGCWSLPGGGLEPAETLEECVWRETLEETVVTCHSLSLWHVFSGPELYYKYPNGDEVYNVIAAFVCRDFSGALRPEPGETSEIRFHDLKDLPPNISPPDRIVLEKLVASPSVI